MKVTQQIKRATRFAQMAHTGQHRKASNEEYWHHPVRVARLVSRHPEATEEMIIAALLHDTVEDTEATLAEIACWFGDNVSHIVGWLTDVYTKEAYPSVDRATRKSFEALRMRHAPWGVRVIKRADMADNLSDIHMLGTEFAKIYVQEKAELESILDQADADDRRFPMVIASAAARDMLDEYNPSWREEFATEREALEYYGLEAMVEYDYTVRGEAYAELDFND